MPRKGASEELADGLVVARETNLRGAATQIQATALVTLMAIQMTRITLILLSGSAQGLRSMHDPLIIWYPLWKGHFTSLEVGYVDSTPISKSVTFE